MNPNARQPNESFESYRTRRKFWNQAERLMDRTPRVIYNPAARLGTNGKPTPYVRAKDGPLMGEKE